MIDPSTLARRLEAMVVDPNWRRFHLDKDMAALCAGALRAVAPPIAIEMETQSATTAGRGPKDDSAAIARKD